MANPMKALGQLLKIFPAILKFLKFTLITIPKFISKVIKEGFKFVKKSIPLLMAIVIMYFLIFLGIQVFLRHVTNTPDLIPHVPLMLFTAYIIYQMVMTNAVVLQKIQTYIFSGFLFLFGNPLLRRAKVKWPFKGVEKPTVKNIAKLSKWIVMNPVQVVFVLSAYYFVVKFILVKFSSQIISFFKRLILNIFRFLGFTSMIKISEVGLGEFLADNPIALIVFIILSVAGYFGASYMFKNRKPISDTSEDSEKVLVKKFKKSKNKKTKRRKGKKSSSKKSSSKKSSSKKFPFKK
jgi:hypothetical protein